MDFALELLDKHRLRVRLHLFVDLQVQLVQQLVGQDQLPIIAQLLDAEPSSQI